MPEPRVPRSPKAAVRRKVLIVSGDKQLRITVGFLTDQPDVESYTARTAEEALELMRDLVVHQVVIDAEVPAMGGRRLKSAILRTHPGVQVLLLSSFAAIRSSADVLRFGPSDFIVEKDDLQPLIRNSILLSGAQTELNQLERCYGSTVKLLVSLLEMQDPYRSGDCHYITRYARKLGTRLQLPAPALEALNVAAMLRNVWRFVLHRPLPEALSDEEHRLVRNHTELTVQILEEIDFPWDVKTILYSAHEEYDGTGYPDGIKGRAIPLGARILAVVDAYQAMVSPRPHRPPVARDRALHELVQGAGAKFDPEVVEIFVELLGSEEETIQSAKKKGDTILVLDREAADLSLLRVKLNFEGYKVLGAASGKEGLELAKRQKPSVVLTATELSDMTGLELYEQLLAHFGGELPAVFLATPGSRVEKRDLLLRGAEEVLYKPLNFADLLVRLDIILKRNREQRDVQAEPRTGGINGSLSDLGVPEIVQILEMGRKTAAINIETSAHTIIYVKQGEVAHAIHGDLTGEAAFLKILRLSNARFSVTHGVISDVRSIHRTNIDLILDCLRRLDEEHKDEFEALMLAPAAHVPAIEAGAPLDVELDAAFAEGPEPTLPGLESEDLVLETENLDWIDAEPATKNEGVG